MLKTEGIILRETRFRDTSKILNIYTKDLGKISVMGQGAYRPNSKLIAVTQVFAHSEFQLKKGRSFFYINQGDIINPFYNLREKIERVIYGSYMLELIQKSLPEEEENEKIFLLLQKGLNVLSTLEENFLQFIIAYELKFVSFLGYRPYLEQCVQCENRIFSSTNFSIKQGGLVCNSCCALDDSTRKISRRAYENLINLLYIPLEKVSEIQGTKEEFRELHRIITEYILFNIDRKQFNSLNSIELI